MHIQALKSPNSFLFLTDSLEWTTLNDRLNDVSANVRDLTYSWLQEGPVDPLDSKEFSISVTYPLPGKLPYLKDAT